MEARCELKAAGKAYPRTCPVCKLGPCQREGQGHKAMPDDGRNPYFEFQNELAVLINKHSLENRTDTPDFILARYVVEALEALEHQHRAKKYWCSDDIQKPTI